MADPVLEEFLRLIAPVRGRIARIILFGSRARGQALPGSDYDILLVVDRRDPGLRKSIFSAVVEVELKFGAVISPKIYAQDDFARLLTIPTPFLKHVQQEGIDLDRAA